MTSKSMTSKENMEMSYFRMQKLVYIVFKSIVFTCALHMINLVNLCMKYCSYPKELPYGAKT